MIKRRKIILIIFFVFIFWPLVHLWSIAGPYLSLSVFPVILSVFKKRKKVIDRILLAQIIALGFLLSAYVCYSLVLYEYNCLRSKRASQESGKAYFLLEKAIFNKDIYKIAVKAGGIDRPANIMKANIKYDPQLVQILSVSPIKQENLPFEEINIDNKKGLLSIILTWPDANIPETVEFVSIKIKLTGKSSTKISLLGSSAILSADGYGTNISNLNPQELVFVSEGTQTKADIAQKTMACSSLIPLDAYPGFFAGFSENLIKYDEIVVRRYHWFNKIILR